MAKGESSRTPGKHMMLNYCLGRIVGVGGTGTTDEFVDYANHSMVIVDQCAGDGRANEEDGTSSPEIICKHAFYAENPRFGRPFDVKVYLIEKNEYTFLELEKSVDTYSLKPKKVTLINGDARLFDHHPEHAKQPYYINADPNAITTLPITPEFRDKLTSATTYTVTLGCNPKGIKRMPKSERLIWYDYIDILSSNLPSWHDVILCYLHRDSSQWAYLLRVPSKWCDKMMREIEKKGRMFGHKTGKICITSIKTSRERFKQFQDHLFLTEKEKEELNCEES